MVRVVLFGAAGVLLMALGLHAAFFGGGDTARDDARLFTGVVLLLLGLGLAGKCVALWARGRGS